MPARILLAEDEIIVGKSIERMLTRQGYEVCGIATTGQEAISSVMRYHPDLLLMDIKLRGEMDGVEVSTRIHKLFDVPVVYLTAHSDPESLQRAKITRPYGYLIKPVEERELSIVVELALNLYESERNVQVGQAQYRTLLETTLDGFWVVDAAGNLVDVNESYCSMVGYSRGELLQMPIRDLVVEEAAEDVENRIGKILEVGWERFESRHRGKDGRLVDTEISARFIHDQGLIFVFLRDITERKKIETEILELNETLQQRAEESLALYQAEREQREFSEQLSEVSRILVSTLDVNVVLDRIMAQISSIVKNDVCNIMLLEGNQTKVVRSRGYDDFDAGTFIETYVFPLSGLPVRQQIAETGESVLVSDVYNDPRWKNSEEGSWLRSYIAVPIYFQHRVAGLINVGNSLPGFYTEEHVKRLQAFAYQAAVAFQNASLYEETRKSASQLEILSHRLLETQESERRSIARELHDEVGQGLTAVEINLRSVLRSPASEPIRAEIQNCIELLGVVLQQVRSISLNLHPSLLDDLGLIPALRWLIDREAQWFGFSAQLVADLPEGRLPATIELVCYRVAQEALTNVARHAEAGQVVVELWMRSSDLHLIVRDNGVGFNMTETTNDALKGTSLGLLGMQERVALVNGTLEINSSEGVGTEIHARIPVRTDKSSTRLDVR